MMASLLPARYFRCSVILSAVTKDATVQDQLAWTADFSWAMAHKVTDVYDDDLGRWFSPGVAAH